jgi:putative IMPACT (imprinted ancient) family translation regulator
MSHSSEFRTLAAPSESIIREKMSKFIALAFPVSTAEEARAVVKRVENQ